MEITEKKTRKSRESFSCPTPNAGRRGQPLCSTGSRRSAEPPHTGYRSETKHPPSLQNHHPACKGTPTHPGGWRWVPGEPACHRQKNKVGFAVTAAPGVDRQRTDGRSALHKRMRVPRADPGSSAPPRRGAGTLPTPSRLSGGTRTSRPHPPAAPGSRPGHLTLPLQPLPARGGPRKVRGAPRYPAEPQQGAAATDMVPTPRGGAVSRGAGVCAATPLPGFSPAGAEEEGGARRAGARRAPLTAVFRH